MQDARPAARRGRPAPAPSRLSASGPGQCDVVAATSMTWPSLIWRDLLRRPARTIFTAVGVGLGVALIVALLAISNGVQETANDLTHVGRADFGLYQADVSDFTRSLLPAPRGGRGEEGRPDGRRPFGEAPRRGGQARRPLVHRRGRLRVG